MNSPGSTRVVVGHEAESINNGGQLIKLLPAKHPWAPRTDNYTKFFFYSLAWNSLRFCFTQK